jgi:hypothetical protein
MPKDVVYGIAAFFATFFLITSIGFSYKLGTSQQMPPINQTQK